MALHLVLFGGYLLAVLGILKRLAIPTWCASLAGGFTLLITWHDRPDSLAQLLGILAVYAWVRSRAIFQLVAATAPPARAWSWWMSVFVVLCLCTSLQIGGVYLLIMAVGTVVACHFGGEHIPIGPLALLFIAPVAGVLIALIWIACLWATH